MTLPAVVINERMSVERTTYEFRLRGNIFAPDIEGLGDKIGEVVRELGQRRAEFVFDLTEADGARFKPTRLYGVFHYLGQEIKQRNLDASLQLYLTEEQRNVLLDLDDLPNVEVVVADPPVGLNEPVEETQASSKQRVRPSEFRLSSHMVQELMDAQRPSMLSDWLQNVVASSSRPTALTDDAVTRVSHEVVGTLVDFAKRVQRLATLRSLPYMQKLSERLPGAALTFVDPIAALLQDNLMLRTNLTRDVVHHLHEELRAFLISRTISASWGELNVASDGFIYLGINRPEERPKRSADKVRVTRLH